MVAIAPACLICVTAAKATGIVGQPAGFNYDEPKVPRYSLPDPLTFANGERVADAATWRNRRRPELLALFETHVYGRSASRPEATRFQVGQVDRQALGGTAVRKEVSVLFTGKAEGPRMDLLIYVPASASGPVPAFVGLNFNGNHGVNPDEGITLSSRWMRGGSRGVVENRATQASRGADGGQWPVDLILSRGFGLVTAYCGDLEPDHPAGWKEGVRSHFKPDTIGSAPTAEGASWGAIGAWAWGLSRALDYLETDSTIDARRVAVIGHSRLGKTALWAGARDERFALVVSNESGEGGAAITRRRFGETIARINTSFPHWFCDNYKRFNDREDDLPVDFHQLLALVAPRPLYVASAAEDLWADPRGEFLAARHAEPVYKLLGTKGLGVAAMPPPNTPVGETIAYHVRKGTHDLTRYDWEQYLAFAGRHFSK